MHAFSSALELAAALRERRLSPVEAVQHYLRVVEARNASLNALIWRRDRELLAEAKAAEATIMSRSSRDRLPPFFGVPLPIKDLTEVAGEPVRFGSRAAGNYQGRIDTTVVSLLRQAGFLFMGRSNTPEFGSFPVTDNVLYGPCRNPWNLEHTPGGSSGGAAAAVAAGMAPIAHASDGGGSIRIPAACCGLVGLKPSRGRVPKGPYVTEIMLGFASDGCVSKTVADTAAVLDVLSQRNPLAWSGLPPPERAYLEVMAEPPPRLRIGYTFASPFVSRVEQSNIDAVMQTVTLLGDLGHNVTETKFSWPGSPEQLMTDFATIWATSMAYLENLDWEQLEPMNAGLRQHGLGLTAFEYVRASLRLQVFSARILSQWGKDFDLLLTPVLAKEPPAVGWFHDAEAAAGRSDPMYMLDRAAQMVPYTAWCNITGQPAISLPVFTAKSGLPIGVQLAAAPCREDLLLQVARELEDATKWYAHLPV